jgi:hypothetical protein
MDGPDRERRVRLRPAQQGNEEEIRLTPPMLSHLVSRLRGVQGKMWSAVSGLLYAHPRRDALPLSSAFDPVRAAA